MENESLQAMAAFSLGAVIGGVVILVILLVHHVGEWMDKRKK